MHENTIRIAWPRASLDIGLLACESMPSGKTERNINVRTLANILAESNKITERKLKLLYVRWDS